MNCNGSWTVFTVNLQVLRLFHPNSASTAAVSTQLLIQLKQLIC